MSESSLEWLQVGFVARSHGLRGDLIVRCFHYDPSNLLAAKTVALAVRKENDEADFSSLKTFRVESSKLLANAAREIGVRLHDVRTRDASDALVGQQICLKRIELGLDADEIFLADLVGFRVLVDGKDYGVVSAVQSYPASDVLVVKRAEGTPIEVPYVHPYIVRTDAASRVIEAAFLEDFEEST